MAPILALVPLAGCNGYVVLQPKGMIGADERSLILFATGLMLLVVVPVILLTLLFAWRYRASNTAATYAPEWSHSGVIEVVVWLVPCAIVAALATVTWTSSHALDPYKPIASAQKPINIDVVSLDWKWLFIYPDLNIATVNQIAFPVGTPVEFHLASAAVMNSFFIPQLGGQIYTMSGMETKLGLVANEPGSYDGISSNYSGAGFSDMKFKALAMSKDGFAAWLRKARASSETLSVARYKALSRPSEKSPVTYFASVAPNLFHDIVRRHLGGAEGGATMTTAAAKE